VKFTKLTPNFSVKNVKDTILFYRDILGFKLEMVVPNNKNIIEHNLADGKIYNYAMMSKEEFYIKDCNGYILGFGEKNR